MKISTMLKKEFIFWIFIVLFGLFFTSRILMPNYFSEYVISEWLINYSQGFVRRGLTGTFFLLMQTKYDLVLSTLRYFSYATFLLFAGIYVLKVRKSIEILNWESLSIVLFLPSLIFFPIYDPDVIGRKEFLFFLGLLINLFLLQNTVIKSNKIFNKFGQEADYKNNKKILKQVNNYCYKLFIWYNFLSIPTALNHEGIIFLALPLNMIITVNLLGLVFSTRKTLWQTILIYLPTIITAVVCLMSNGNYKVALGICESWDVYLKDIASHCKNELPGALQYFNISIVDTLRLVFQNNVSYIKTFFTWMFMFFINVLILARASSSIITNSLQTFIEKHHDKNISINPARIIASFSFKYAFIPFIFSSLMYILALDWGRWFFITSITYTLCLLTPSLINLEIIGYAQNNWILSFLAPIYSNYSRVNALFVQPIISTLGNLVYYALLVYTFSEPRIPHFGMSTDSLFEGLIFNLSYTYWAFVRVFI
jgi:hypothetical protein